MEHLIVGIDPGKTSAVACLNLEGTLLCLKSKKHAGISWIVKEINTTGIPSIIATDRACAGNIVKKVTTIFSAQLYVPNKNMCAAQKRLLAQSIDAINQHEIDAYASAANAYNSYINKFKQIRHQLEEYEESTVDNMKAKVVKKYSLYEAINNKKANRR